MFGPLRGISEWAERAFVKEREGGPLARGRGQGSRGGQCHVYAGQRGWVWPSILVSECLCEFPPKVLSWPHGTCLGMGPGAGIVGILLGTGV